MPADHPGIPYKVLDHDIAVLNVATWTVESYLTGAGTVLHHLAVHPSTGDLFVLNTEARNLVRFEPALRGHVVDHRITRFSADASVREFHDLNEGFDYSILPNPAARSLALAEPTALAFTGAEEAWITAFGTDRIARVNLSSGVVLERIDLRLPGKRRGGCADLADSPSMAETPGSMCSTRFQHPRGDRHDGGCGAVGTRDRDR